MHTGSAGKPSGLPVSTGKREYKVEGREARPARVSYQVPESLVFAWILTAQNICRQTVHLTHVQLDPVKEVKEKRAGWKEKLSSHTKAVNSTFPKYRECRTHELCRKWFIPLK